MIIVRKAGKDDLHDLVKFLINNEMIEEFHNDKGDYYICEENNILCGCGMLIKLDRYCIIKNIFVSMENRRKKLGTAIAKAMLNAAELGGANTALCVGGNEKFSSYLKFKQINIFDLPKEIKSAIKNLNSKNIYIVSLADYFNCTC